MYVSRKVTFLLISWISLVFSFASVAASNTVGYSGRLVNADGSPVTGTVNLKFEVFNSTGPTYLEEVNINSLNLSNGIYTVELDIPNLQQHIKDLQAGETLLMRVTELGSGTVYDYQKFLAVPMAAYASSIANGIVTPESLSYSTTCNTDQLLVKDGLKFKCIDQTAAVTVDNSTIQYNGLSQLSLTTTGVADGTYTSVTVDAYGRITGGSNPAPSIGTSEIENGSIIDEDISATAAISWSKINYPIIDKSYVGLGNVLNVAQIPASDLDNSGTLDSATQVPSELAIKGYVDTYADAKVIDDMSGAQTTIAPSVNAVKNYVTTQVGAVNESQWTTIGSDIYYSTGNVAIGTTTPLAPLHVTRDVGSNQNMIIEGDSAVAGAPKITFRDTNGGTTDATFQFDKTNGYSVIGGNVGIGTTTPTQKLTVAGNMNVTTGNDICIEGGKCLSTTGTGSGSVTSITAGTGLTGGTITTTGTIAVDVGTTNGKIAQVGAGDKLADAIINYNPALDVALTGFATGSASSILATDTILQAFAKVQGQINAQSTLIAGLTSDDVAEGSTNLYFNDTRAQAAAVVDSTAGSETNKAPSVASIKSYINDRASQWTTIGSDIYYSTGNVAIGTTGPLAPLHVTRDVGSSQNMIIEGDSAVAGAPKITFRDTNGGTTDATFQFDKTNGYGVIGGNVGIGTATPTQKLTVAGSMNVTTGNDICIDGSSCLSTVIAANGEQNTASSAGGTSIYKTKTGTDLVFKGLTSSTDLTLTDNANDINLAVNTSNGVNELLRLDGTGLVPSSLIGVSTILNTPLTGYSVGTNTPLAATDNVLDAYGKLQAQINANYTAITGLDTDDIPEGISNLYFNNTRAQTAAVVNSTAGTETVQAPSVSAMKNYVTTQIGTINQSQWTTSGSNIYYNTGLVGIGTSAPTTALHVTNATPTFTIGNTTVNQANGGEIHFKEDDTAGMKIHYYADTDKMSIIGRAASTDSELVTFMRSGNVGIGTTSPTSKLSVSGNASISGDTSISGDLKMSGNDSYIWTNGSGTGVTGIYDSANNRVLFFASESTGNIGIGTSSPTEKLHVAGNVLSAAYLYTSDERFKENIETIIDPLHKVKSLRGVTFDWKRDEFPDRHFPEEKTVGFIAQEVEKVQPELVKTGKDGYKSVQYGNITALLVEALKSVSDKIDELFSSDKEVKREIASLKEENEQLKAEMKEMKEAIKALQKANKK